MMHRPSLVTVIVYSIWSYLTFYKDHVIRLNTGSPIDKVIASVVFQQTNIRHFLVNIDFLLDNTS